MFTELYREDKMEEGDRGGQEDKGGESKGERQIQLVISSLSVLHSPELTKRFTELGREEKEEGGDTGDLVEEKGESKGGERSQASNLASKSKWVLKTGFLKVQKLITNTKKQRLKI